MLRLITFCLLLAAPVAANACDLDGMFGYHRYNPFAGQIDQQASAKPQEFPQQASVQEDNRPTPAQELDGQRAGQNAPAEPSSETSQDEPRKWETPGVEPVSAEDLATYH